jgi:hypothetical protein
VSVTNILWLGEHIAAGWRKEVVGVYKFPSMQCLFKEEVAAYGPRPLDFEVKDGKVTDLLVQAWDLVRVRNGNMEVLGNNDRILAFHPVTKTALQEVRNQGKRPAFRYVLTLQRGDRTLGTFEHRGDPASHVEFCCAAFSRNGKYVVYAAENGLFHLHEVETGKEVFKARYSVGTVHSELGSDTYDTPSLLYPKVESIDVTVGPHGSIIIAVGGGDGVKVYVI